ncbi:plasmid stabilization protein [Buttiauxella selenatireducens]|uniref:Antitoxin n=1 Tax=Buttiauxella selenatireducens TaxID=3073902 RepID=A0ABY9SCK4_9ENTR|nr:type II toxin-antitoxin system Phd/YefM family antitoxin [Buttiauxella sp. R73]WMY75229.1 plasmid stabilization protein [Buttiauxella sp. R73]
MPFNILSRVAANITDLKKDPMGTVQAGEGGAVVILNRNEPAFYCVPVAEYAALLEIREDMELMRIAQERADEKGIKVSLDEL